MRKNLLIPAVLLAAHLLSSSYSADPRKKEPKTDRERVGSKVRLTPWLYP